MEIAKSMEEEKCELCENTFKVINGICGECRQEWFSEPSLNKHFQGKNVPTPKKEPKPDNDLNVSGPPFHGFADQVRNLIIKPIQKKFSLKEGFPFCLRSLDSLPLPRNLENWPRKTAS